VNDRPKVDEPTALDLLQPARVTRERVHVFQPMVLYCPRRGKAYMASMDAGESLEVMLSALLAEMRASLGPAMWIAVTTDAYAKRAETPEDIPTQRLGEAFADGDPEVIEQMIVVLRHRYKPTEMAAQTYRYTPVDGYEWDEPEIITQHDGPMLAVLNYYF
jgi:hypothetical protein